MTSACVRVGEGGSGDRTLLTVLAAEITEPERRTSAELDLAATHLEQARAALGRCGARELGADGASIVGAFSGPPSRVLRAAREIVQAGRSSGVATQIGIHTGECQIADRHVTGPPLTIAAEIRALARADEILVSFTTYGMLAGLPYRFQERGSYVSAGSRCSWALYALTAVRS
jgi:class 3 adenylate cyclase